jgi:hypothetical protein
MSNFEAKFTLSDVSRATGVPESTLSTWLAGTRLQDPHFTAFNAVHLAIVKAFSDFGFSVPVAVGLAHAAGFTAARRDRAGWIVVRKNQHPETGYMVPEDTEDPGWCDAGSYEVGMLSTLGNATHALRGETEPFLVLNIGAIEERIVSTLQGMSR